MGFIFTLLAADGMRVAATARSALDAEQPSAPAPDFGRMRPADDGGVRRIVINIPTTNLFLYQGNRVIGVYPVAVGRRLSKVGKVYRRTETPTGEFVVVRKDSEPYWYPPAWLKREMGWPAKYRVPPGPQNPLGNRWISFWRPGYEGYGIHGTIAPDLIGQAVSLGCVRMLNEDVEELFEMVEPGTPVSVTHNLAMVYRTPDGVWHLAVGPDLYLRGGDTAEAARRELARYGLSPAVLEGEDLSDLSTLTAGRDLIVAVEPVPVKVRWLYNLGSQDGVREGDTILVPLKTIPRPLQRYFRADGETVRMYGRPLEDVRSRDGVVLLPLGEVLARFGLVIDDDLITGTASIHF